MANANVFIVMMLIPKSDMHIAITQKITLQERVAKMVCLSVRVLPFAVYFQISLMNIVDIHRRLESAEDIVADWGPVCV